MNRNGRVLHNAIITILVTITATVTILLGTVLVGELEEQFLEVRAVLVGELEIALAQELSWDTVSPSILRGITIYGVRMTGDSGTAQSVSISLRLAELVRGDTRRMVPNVVVRQPRLILETPEDFRRLRQTLEFIRGAGDGSRIIAVQVENGDLTVSTDQGTVRLNDLDGQIQLDTARLTGRFNTFLSAETTLRDETFTVTSGVTAVIDSSRSGDPAGLTLELNHLRGNHFTAADQTFRVERRAENIRLERIRSQDALDFEATVNLQTRTLNLATRSHALVPSSLVTFHGPWEEINAWINTPITTDSRASFDLDGSLIEAQGNVAGRIVHPSVPEPFSLRADYRLTPDRLYFDTLTVDARQGRARFSGSWRPGSLAPDGRVRFSGFSYAGSPVLEGEAFLSGSTATAGVSSDQISANGYPVYDLVAHYRAGARTGTGTVYNNLESTFSLEPDRPGQLQAAIRFSDLDNLTGRLELTDISPSRAVEAAPAFGYNLDLPAAVRGFRVDGTVRFDRRNGEVMVRVPYISARDEREPDRLIAVAGEYRNGEITLSHYYVREADITILGVGSGTVFPDGSLDFSTNFSINRIDYYLDGRYSSRGVLTVTGPHGLTATVRRTGGDGIAFEAAMRNAPIPYGRTRISLDLDGIYYNRTSWYLNVRELVARDVPVTYTVPGSEMDPRTARIVLAAALQPDTVQIAITELNDGTSTLAGTMDLRYFFTDSGPEVSLSGRMGGVETSELYRFAARYSQEMIALDLRFAASPLVRVSPRIERGTVQGTIQVVGDLDAPEFRAFLESDQMIFNGTAASFRFLTQSDASVLRLTQGEFGYGTVRIGVPQLILDREEGELNGDVRFRRLDQNVTLSISGTTEPVPELSPQLLRTNALDLSVRVTPEETDSIPEDPRAWQYRLVRTAEETVLNRADGAIRAQITDGGEFSLSVGGPIPYQGQASGIITPARMEVTVSNILVDLQRVPMPAAAEQFQISGGTVTGSLRLIGAPGDPDFFGTLNVNDFEITTPLSPDPLGPAGGSLIFEEKLVRLQPIRTTVGQAPVEFSARVLLNRFSLEQFELDLALPGENGIHVVNTFGPVNVDGYARGNLLVSGTPENLNVTGTLNVYGAELAVAPDFEPGMATGPNATIDLNVRTGRAVRFIWPDTELPIIRSNFATGQQINIQANTREETFAVNGTLAIQSGDVFYFDRNFLLRDGRIEFRETQDDFDPRVTARAELREATPEGPVRIYLLADGQRLSEFSPRFDSSPPLESAEIVAILGGSILQMGADDSISLPAALLSTSDIVTQFGFFRQFENAVRDQLDLDLFAIRTSVVQNILLTAITPVDDQVQRQVAPSLGTYLNNTSVFMGRYIGDSVFGQVVLQMRSRDPEIFPDDDGIQRLGGVLIDSEISLEWQTPFFLLEWNFAPQNPEELFIRDNTFSFLWSFSY